MILTANAGLCEQARNAVMHNAIVKFGLAMGGVALSSIIIFRPFVKKAISLNLFSKVS